MGTDVHMVGQQKRKYGPNHSRWENFEIPEPFQDRDYAFFAILAGVRNGYGFAGVPIFEPIKPMSKPKGLPSDYEPILEKDNDDDEDCEPRDKYLSGEHSASWLSLREFKEYNLPIMRKCGYIEKNTYIGWDKISQPKQWCGGIDGPGVIAIDSALCERIPVFHDFTHVKVYWDGPAIDLVKWRTLINLLDLYKWRPEDSDEDVRIVFDFDS